MAIQILPNIPSWGSILGQGLGGILGSGLSGAAEGFLEKRQKQQNLQNVMQGLIQTGFQPEEAQGIALLTQGNPQILHEVIKQKIAGQQQAQTQASEEAELSQLLGGAAGVTQPAAPPEVGEQVSETFVEDVTVPSRAPVIKSVKKTTTKSVKRARQEPKTIKEAFKKSNYFLTDADFEDIHNTPKGFKAPQSSSDVRNALLRAKTPGAKKQLTQLLKDTRQDEQSGMKETQKYYDKIEDEKEGAVTSEFRLGKMEKLIKSGKLPSRWITAPIDFLKRGIKFGPHLGFSIDLSKLYGADAQEFEKLSNDFVRDAKKWFGARLTDTDLKTFLKTIPNLVQSDEGKVRIIHNLRLFNKAALAKEEAMKQIMKEHGNKRPANLRVMVNDRVDPILNRLAKDFKTIAKLKYKKDAFEPTGIGGLPRKTISELGFGGRRF